MLIENKIIEFKREYVDDIKKQLSLLQIVMEVLYLLE